MSERSQVELWDRRGKQLVPAVLIDDVDIEGIQRAVSSWKPVIEGRVADLTKQGIPRNEWPEHAHWDWQLKAEHVKDILAYQILGIEFEEAMQGLMLVATEGKACRVLTQLGKPLVYVHYIATAPWNDPDFTPEPQFGGVGKIFMASAIQLSIDNGFRGRIGLHSLPQAEIFYTGCEMTDMGLDPSPKAQNLRYYEMTQEQATAFLTKGQL